MGLILIVSLYTSRIVLQQLGEVDYGIYGVVGGVVALFSMFHGSMAGSTQRYLTFDLGKNDLIQMNRTFNTAIQIHIVIAILFIVLIEPIGLWFMHTKMQIPADRMFTADIIFQCAILSTMATFLSIPYLAMIIAYEKMGAFAYISIIDVFLKLFIAFFLIFSPFSNKLIVYALLMLIAPILTLIIYIAYCYHHFNAVTLNKFFDKSLFKEMLSFAGWSLWGNTSSVFATQGLNVLLNIFFGPIVNAARSIAVQIQSLITQFSRNFQLAVNPQITKTYANNEYGELHSLILRSAKITLYLLLIIALPIIIEMPFILTIWLGEFPEYTPVFARIIIVTSIIDAIANPIITAVGATGRIKIYQIVVGGILLLTLPISYLILKIGGNPASVFYVNLFVVCLAFFIRLLMAKPLININILPFCKEIILRGGIVSIIAWFVPYYISTIMPYEAKYNIAIIITTIIWSIIISYTIGLNKSEKQYVTTFAKKTYHKL